MTTIVIACDGSCIQQGDFRKGDDTLRPGAAGFVADVDGAVVGRVEPHANGTNGAMEVRALMMGLMFTADLIAVGKVPDGARVRIVCDSVYAVRGFNEWLPKWADKGYTKPGGLANADDWREIDRIKKDLGPRIEVAWVKAHTNARDHDSRMNRLADEAVNKAARTQAPFDDVARILPAAASLAERYAGDRPKASDAIPPEDARRLYDAVSSGDLVPVVPAIADMADVAQDRRDPLTRLADDPQLRDLVSQGIAMALEDRRLTARYAPETVAAARAIELELDRRLSA